MEQKQICSSSIFDRLPPLSANYPWLVAQIVDEDEDVNDEEEEDEEEEDTEEQVFFTVHDPMSRYHCRIPKLLGRHIRGCFHGWVVLSNGDKWSLWNPITSKFVYLPRLILKDGDSYNDINDCCLSSPPDVPGSVLLLTRDTKANFVFCRLDRKRKRLRWVEMSYSKKLTSVTGHPDGFLVGLTCCNGKIYAWTNDESDSVIQIHIVVKEKEVVISLLPFVSLPSFDDTAGRFISLFLKGSCEELFVIVVGFTDVTRKKLVDVFLYKLDMISLVWTEMNELEGMVFFVDAGTSPSVTCSPAIASDLGGYIYILHETGKVIYSYNVKDKTISQRRLDLPSRSGALRTSYISVWAIPEFRLQGDDGETKCKSDSTQVEDKEKEDGLVVRSCKNDEVEFNNNPDELQLLLNIPFHVLEMIMEFCVGVEYLNFRATCKLCHLAAPVIRWSNEKAQRRRRLQTYSLTSPWLMAFEKYCGIISFTDPMFGNKYTIRASQKLFFGKRILCSRFGWLLLYIGLRHMVFFNPFTSDIRKLPKVDHVDTFCFSAPPTSPNCIVVAFSKNDGVIYLHSVGRERSWRIIHLDFGGADFPFFEFPVFCGQDVYALSKEGGLQVLKGDNLSLEVVVAESPSSYCRTCAEINYHYLMKCDEHLLLVIVGDIGESVEVFRFKDSTKEWEKTDSLGRHMIYISDVTCLCMDAKTPEMENKIYFPRLHSGKMVFYSLETCRYHTFNGRNVEQNSIDIFEIVQQRYPQAWIEPTWS